MGGIGVIDRFLNVFTTLIESGFGFLRPEVAFLTAVLVIVDMTLAGLFWAMGGEDAIARLIKKTLYVGFFALIIGNWKILTGIVFDSFAGLGLQGAGAPITYAEFLQPGRLARVGIEAGRPILQAVGQLTGFISFFENFVQIFILLLAWLIVIATFFILAVQLFVTLIEFKLTTLAGFVLVPFGLWGKSAFLAERVLGNVIASGVKVLVLAVIVGIGTTLFGHFSAAITGQPSLEDALAIMLASLAMLGLGIFGPGIATGLVSGAPQLGAGAAAGTGLAAVGLGVAGGAVAVGAGRVGLAGVRAASSLAGGARLAYDLAAATSGERGVGAVGAGLTGVARAGAGALAAGPANLVRRAGETLRRRAEAGERAAWVATGGQALSGSAAGTADDAPAWARRLRSSGLSGAEAAARATRQGDSRGQGANPRLDPEER
jgi:type IV secretion system protein TrbL